jgi:multimeric flavodoxin WrbA
MKKLKILGIVGSSRNRIDSNVLLEYVNNSLSFQDLHDTIYEISSAKKISNSEAIIMASLFGATAQGGEIDLLKLPEYISDVEKFERSTHAMKKIKKADGIVISSPVYFGDRSSYINTLFNQLRSEGTLPITGKTVGFVSVGAKRNGGQETTNVYGLYDSLQLGASIVGNGPPTSQYGGTAWAGDIGSIIDDNFGLQTSMGTGKRVAQVARIMSYRPIKNSNPLKILVIMGNEDKKGTVRRFLNTAFEGLAVDLDFRYLNNYKIRRCNGCRICPQETEDIYKCIIKNDDMKDLYGCLKEADGILFSAYFGGHQSIDSYQTFIERARFIRRNNFELTDIPVSSFHIEEQGVNSIFHIRVLTSMIRHNTIIVGPHYMGIKHSKGILHNQSLKEFGEAFFKKVKIISIAKNKTKKRSPIYLPIGYRKATVAA